MPLIIWARHDADLDSGHGEGGEEGLHPQCFLGQTQQTAEGLLRGVAVKEESRMFMPSFCLSKQKDVINSDGIGHGTGLWAHEQLGFGKGIFRYLPDVQVMK